MIEKTRNPRLGLYGSILGFLFLLNSCEISQVANPTNPSAATTCIDPASVATDHADYRGHNYTGPYGYCLYNLNQLPDAKELYEVDLSLNESDREGTNFNSNIKLAEGDRGKRVVLYAHGGPANVLLARFEYDGMFEDAEMVTEDDWSFLSVYQYQNYYPFAHADSEITMNEASRSVAFSSAALYQVAKYFHSLGRKVYIVSHSYGALISSRMMADYKYENQVEKVLVLSGRLQMPEEVYKSFANKSNVSFHDENEDGLWREPNWDEAFDTDVGVESITNKIQAIQEGSASIEEFPLFVFTGEAFSNIIENYSPAQIRNVALSFPKLQAAACQYDLIDQYTRFKVPLTKAYFVTAKQDDAIGYFSEEEIAFAKNTAVTGGLHQSEGEHLVRLKADLTYYLSLFND